jgi:hypothetical protein
MKKPIIPSALDKMAEADDALSKSGALELVREEAKLLRRARDSKAELEEQLSAVNRTIQKITMETLPDLMTAAGIDRIGLEAEGNHVGLDIVVRPFYEASIAAGWPDEKREAAFSALEQFKAGDLIKSQVTAMIPRGEQKKLEKLRAAAEKLGIDLDVKRSVHASTLRAWLREQVEADNPVPPLEAIGGYVGQRAEVKERKS